MGELERCRPWIEDALAYNMTGQTYDDVVSGLAQGIYRLWPGERCAVVTEHYEGRDGGHLNFFLAGGDITELESMLPVIEGQAKKEGVKRLTLFGRRGWQRTFIKDAGYKTHWVVMTKELT